MITPMPSEPTAEDNRKAAHNLKALFDKAAKLYPHYATTPVSSRIDPRAVQAADKYGNFMRLPLGRGLNRWCFENDARKDSFIHDYKQQGAEDGNA